MSQYSRAVVVQRADAANARATEALQKTAVLDAAVKSHRLAVEARLAATLTLARREYEPALRLARAGFAARLHWLLTGRLPSPVGISPVVAPALKRVPAGQLTEPL